MLKFSHLIFYQDLYLSIVISFIENSFVFKKSSNNNKWKKDCINIMSFLWHLEPCQSKKESDCQSISTFRKQTQKHNGQKPGLW